ncbi:cytochrome c family protein [Tropicimonas sp. IMCC6043]|uniref:c-type cytochrome n=1 Tax=Tropicimonas sp. IMCC6043 TaxID=2510645 RepID=UPI00101E1D94|nr:c-type cytochrome [Tropicimonas sp. IMCC6043]RYH07410.1 c-type cytochrome [Tropicimonas sp. IMCC6043]
MFDTMTLTKAVGAICGSLLIFLLAGWAGSGIYSMGGGHGASGEHAQAYLIDTGDGGDEAGAEAVEEVDFETLLANADPGKGANLYKKCQACHKLEEGANATGPSLYQVVGRPVEAVDSFAGYSGALAKVVDVWTPEHLNQYLADPKGFAPGNKMSFAGFKKVEDRADIIAFLQNPGG